jgi:hypothetical protein
MRRRGAARVALSALLGVNLILPSGPEPAAAAGFVEAYPVTAAAMRAAGPPYADWVADGRWFLIFDARGDGRVVEVLGDLAGADRIAVLVPGVGSTLADFDRGLVGVAGLLWHQPVLVGVTALTARGGLALPGLHTAPDGPAWLLARCCWLPLLVAVLVTVVRTGRRSLSTDRRSGSLRPGGGASAGRSAECVPTPTQVYDHRRSDRADLQEVIAVRDSDPPSRGRADGQPR